MRGDGGGDGRGDGKGDAPKYSNQMNYPKEPPKRAVRDKELLYKSHLRDKRPTMRFN